MSDPDPVKASEGPLFQQLPPGYWRTRLKLKRMIRFRDLIIHRERWASHIDLAMPLAKLFPGEKLDDGSFPTVQRIEQEIQQAKRMVWWDLHAIGVPTGVIYNERPIAGLEPEEKQYDTIIDYFRLPRAENAHGAFAATMDVLEQGIGLWKGRLRQSKLEWLNPIAWIAKFIRLPITVMERAGLLGHQKTQEMALQVYGRIIQIMMLIVVGLFMVRQGIKFPWKEIFSWVLSK